VGIVRAADAKFMLVNPRMEQAIGLPAKELYERRNFEFYANPRDVEQVRRTLEQRGELPPQEFQMRRADGTRMWAIIAARNFLHQGEPAVLAAMSEVTELRVMEEALRESQEHLRTVVNNAPLILLAVDASGLVSLLEGKPLPSLQLDPELALHRPAGEAFHHLPQLAADLRAAGLGRAFRSIVESGSAVFEFWYQPLTDADGRVTQVIGVGTDITELKAREQALIQAQKMEAVGQLTGGVAHDFNNLLTIILGNTELLEMNLEGLDPELRRQVELIRNAANRGSELTQRLLAFSRRQPLQPRPVDMARFLSDLGALLKRTLGERITLRTFAPAQVWQPVADQGQLANAMINLAVNARDAMPSGGELRIEAENLPREQAEHCGMALAPGDYVALKVIDAGTGMAPEVARRAFDPFFTTKDVGKGSGLGLSMVYGFTQQSGGQVKLDSEPGRGSTVVLYLPRALAPDTVKSEPATAPGQPTGSENILVVEDDPGVREFAVRYLRGLGYRVTAAETGLQALALLDQDPAPDLLFSDVILPGNMTGEELAEKVRLRMPSIKVLFTSGYTSDHLMRDGRLPEGVHLLDKPYKSHQLAAMVRRVLDQRP
jgi:PAS domain S-box-containing protein